jgi:hypothetical protein
MKKFNVSILALAVAVGIAFAFRNMEEGSISGRVTPADGANAAWAIHDTDTLKADIADGTFSLQGAKAGTYTVIVGAKQPFKDVTISNVKVDEGKATDLGEITLQQ